MLLHQHYRGYAKAFAELFTLFAIVTDITISGLTFNDALIVSVPALRTLTRTFSFTVTIEATEFLQKQNSGVFDANTRVPWEMEMGEESRRTLFLRQYEIVKNGL